MKKYITIMLLLFITINLSVAQTNNNTQILASGGGGAVDSATMYLTGTFKNYNPQRAFQINLQNANNGNAKAMNAVAMQYTKGLGVDSNFNLAAYWFSQAAANNYTKAWVNLGMLYKHIAYDSNGFAIACNYFNQALQVNEPSAFFAMGYMYYKGLGCTQSYTNALNLFNQGIAINQSNCMYFKGLCYKFGYGVAINTDSALFYIDTAAKLGYKQANAELYNNSQTSTTARNSSSLNETKQSQNGVADFLPNSKIEFQKIAKSNKPIQLNGEFTGNIFQYDYSGKKLLAQIPISLQVSTNNNMVTGDLFLNNSQSIQLKAIQQGNQLIFSQTSVLQPKTNGQSQKAALIFKSATFKLSHSFGGVGEADTNFLTGTLQLFNTYTHETDKPINIKLQQVTVNNKATHKVQSPPSTDLVVYPNPTSGSCTVSFSQEKTAAVKISIYNLQGKLAFTKIIEQVQHGKQSITIPNFKGAAGIYQVVVLTNGQQQTTAFIKE